MGGKKRGSASRGAGSSSSSDGKTVQRNLPSAPRSREQAIEAAKLIKLRQLSHAKAAKEVGAHRTTVEAWTKSSWWPEIVKAAIGELRDELHDDTVAALSALVKLRHPSTVQMVAKTVVPEFADRVPRVSVDRLLLTVGAVFRQYLPPEVLPEALEAVRAAAAQLEEPNAK
ncbi:MAG: hypothetical protein AAFV77_09505 [Planctomycetota bacterium]